MKNQITNSIDTINGQHWDYDWTELTNCCSANWIILLIQNKQQHQQQLISR